MELLDKVTATLAAKKVSVVEFAESDEYCDKPLYPRQRVLLKLMFLEELEPWEEDVLDFWIAGGRNGNEITISPNIRERVAFLRERGYDHFQEVDLVGGRRGSKGLVTAVASAKVMWDTLQLQDPGKHFGVDPKKEIYFSCIAASEQQAKEFQFADFINTVENCKAFQKYLVKSLETEFRVATPADLRAADRLRMQRGNRVQQRDIARLRGKALAANAGTIRGSASMVLIFDEMAHMIETTEGKASATQVYNAAEPSLDQFGKAAMIFCNSSPYSKIGKFFERHEEALLPFDPNRGLGEIGEDGKLEGNGNPLVMTFQFPSWALYEGYQGYRTTSGYKFDKVQTASPDWNPDEQDENGDYIWSEDDRAGIIKARLKEASNPDTYKVERRGKFAEVEDAYLNPEMVDRMYAGVPMGYDEEGKLLLEPLDSDYGHGARVMYQYHAHLDPSSTTAGFGFALGHVQTFKHKDGSEREHVVFDIIKRWQPEFFEGGAIDWAIVLEEVLTYIDIFRPSQVTFDQFQSDAPIQFLMRQCQERGFSTHVSQKFRTNERNWKQSETFKTALYQGLIHAPNDHPDCHWSNLELKFLIKKTTQGKFPRVDKQEVGPVQTKDMADCIMEVTEVLIGNLVARNVREELAANAMSFGAPGGYNIGGALQGLKHAPELAAFYGQSRSGEQFTPPTRAGAPSRRGPTTSRVRGINRSRGR